ncbi:MAG: BT4734/BF3469 family protein [Bacteroidota bacterium]
MRVNNILTREVPGGASLQNRHVFEYLETLSLLDHYDLDNRQDLKTLSKDFNEYANTNCKLDEFLQAAKFYQKIANRPRFSFFRRPIFNTYPYKTININQLFEIIVEPKYYGTTTDTYRDLNSKGKAKDYKSKNFDYVTFSGYFSKRHSSNLLEESGLLVIDIDKLEDVESVKTSLLNDKNIPTEMLFVSPGGNGLKWVIKSHPDKYEHELFFNGVSTYLKRTHGIEADQSGKDVSRACFVCHDPDVFINPKYL